MMIWASALDASDWRCFSGVAEVSLSFLDTGLPWVNNIREAPILILISVGRDSKYSLLGWVRFS